MFLLVRLVLYLVAPVTPPYQYVFPRGYVVVSHHCVLVLVMVLFMLPLLLAVVEGLVS